jgi:hypothetical protein
MQSTWTLTRTSQVKSQAVKHVRRRTQPNLSLGSWKWSTAFLIGSCVSLLTRGRKPATSERGVSSHLFPLSVMSSIEFDNYRAITGFGFNEPSSSV